MSTQRWFIKHETVIHNQSFGGGRLKYICIWVELIPPADSFQ